MAAAGSDITIDFTQGSNAGWEAGFVESVVVTSVRFTGQIISASSEMCTFPAFLMLFDFLLLLSHMT